MCPYRLFYKYKECAAPIFSVMQIILRNYNLPNTPNLQFSPVVYKQIFIRLGPSGEVAETERETAAMS